MPFRLAIALVLAVLAGAPRVQAGDFLGPRQAGQFQPEADLYYELGEGSRLLLQLQPTFIPAESYSEMTFGAYAVVFVAPYVRTLLDPDKAKSRILELRLGGTYTLTMDPGTVGSSEIVALQADLTPRFYLPWSILATNRNRFEVRWQHAESTSDSFRYRFRLQLEREFDIRVGGLTPFANAEFIWDGATGMWSQFRPQVGLQFSAHWFAKGQAIELNYMLITHLQPARSYDPVLGLILHLYF